MDLFWKQSQQGLQTAIQGVKEKKDPRITPTYILNWTVGGDVAIDRKGSPDLAQFLGPASPEEAKARKWEQMSTYPPVPNLGSALMDPSPPSG